MAKQAYAFVSISDQIVTDLKEFAARPVDPQGYYWLGADQWASGQSPRLGQLWEGNNPGCTFIDVPVEVIDPETLPSNIEEAKARRDEAMAALAKANADYDALLSLG